MHTVCCCVGGGTHRFQAPRNHTNTIYADECKNTLEGGGKSRNQYIIVEHLMAIAMLHTIQSFHQMFATRCRDVVPSTRAQVKTSTSRWLYADQSTSSTPIQKNQLTHSWRKTIVSHIPSLHFRGLSTRVSIYFWPHSKVLPLYS